MLELDLIHTLAFGGVVLMLGYGLRRLVPPLARREHSCRGDRRSRRLAAAAGRARARPHAVRFDTTLQAPLMIAFFTTIGFAQPVAAARGRAAGAAVLRHRHACSPSCRTWSAWRWRSRSASSRLFGVLAGSVTLTAGGTGLAFAPLFESAGVTGAASIAVAVAMAGIVIGALIGSPAATYFIEKHSLAAARGARRGRITVMRARSPRARSRTRTSCR